MARDYVINIRLNEPERSYLGEGAKREAIGPIPLAQFLRGLGMQRASQILGVPFAEWMAQREAPARKTPARKRRPRAKS